MDKVGNASESECLLMKQQNQQMGGNAVMTEISTYRDATLGQLNAALRTLSECVERCPDEGWSEPVHELKFCQTAFHALFFTDLYLDDGIDEMKQQVFHKQHENVFRDYEEFSPKKPEHEYERPWMNLYIQHCRDKATRVVNAENAESLAQQVSFDWLEITRAEMHVYTLRHLEHHAAQLILRLRQQGVDVGGGWVKTGWGPYV